jgi:hypothetical protein
VNNKIPHQILRWEKEKKDQKNEEVSENQSIIITGVIINGEIETKRITMDRSIKKNHAQGLFDFFM